MSKNHIHANFDLGNILLWPQLLMMALCKFFMPQYTSMLPILQIYTINKIPLATYSAILL